MRWQPHAMRWTIFTGAIVTVLVDTNAFVALMLETERHHERMAALFSSLRRQRTPLVVAAPCLLEVFQVTVNLSGYSKAFRSVGLVREFCRVVDLTEPDYVRMNAIMTQYTDAKFDFADAAIMALSERLNITRIATLDRRDFGLFRPSHCEALELLPA